MMSDTNLNLIAGDRVSAENAIHPARRRQDIPKGLVSLAMRSGHSTGQKLVESPLIDAISVIGPAPVGKRIASAAAQNLTKVQLEKGSKNALAVVDDGDLHRATHFPCNDRTSVVTVKLPTAEFNTTVKTADISDGAPA